MFLKKPTRVFYPAFVVAVLVLMTLTGISTHGAPTRTEPNDSINEATELYFDTNPTSDTLDAVDTDDWYKIMYLEGDDIYNAQRYSIGLRKTGGSNVKGIIMEPNGLPIGEIYSDGSIEELEFIVPYDGDYFLLIVSDPKGTSCSYEIYQGGAFDVDNHLNEDYNNQPPGTGFSATVPIANSLHPRDDIVDYFHIVVPPQRSLESTLVFLGGLTFRLTVMNETYVPFAEVGTDEPHVITNDGQDPIMVILRVHVHQSTEGGYPSTKKSYSLDLVLWSHVTTPELNAADPWTMVRTNEDQALYPNINLSKHFIESNGDELEFEMLSEPENIMVTINYHMNSKTDRLLYVDVSIVPEPNWHGDEVLMFRASDRDGNITDSLTVNVSSVNDLPYVTRIGNADYDGGTFNMFAYEDVPKAYTIVYDDDDDPIGNIFFTSNETFSFLEIDPSNGTMMIDAVQEEVGNYWFELQMSDTHDTVSIPINLDIQHVNDAPPEPSIVLTGVDPLAVLPGEEIMVEAVVGPDIDGDVLTFTWDWRDGTTSTGRTSSHIYAEGIHGNRTIILTVSDGSLTSKANVTVFLEKPEDLAVGDLYRVYDDRKGDAVRSEESWRMNDPDEVKKFIVFTAEVGGVDILSLTSQRRGNTLEIILKVSESIQIDGSFHYYLYILPSGYQEPPVDFKNASSWDNITDRAPAGITPYAYREYVGDPVLFNTSTGSVHNQDSLLWIISFSELVSGGMSLPISLENFTLFAYVTHRVDYAESKGIAERYIISDTAGGGALEVDPIYAGGTTGGGGGTNLADIATPTNIGLFIGLIILIVIIGIFAFIFGRKQAKEKKKEEEEFIRHVEKMNAEGKDLFGKDVEEVGSKVISYEELYGAPAPEGHDAKGSEVSPDSLPKAGLGQTIESDAHIMEFQVKAPDMDEE